MRGRPGDRVVVFDGSGDEWQAEVVRVGRAEVALRLVGREAIDRELPFDLTLAVAMPKGERQRWLVEKAVELGVRRLVPLATARSVAEPGSSKLVRAVIEASKQCGRNRMMEIAAVATWTDFLEQTSAAECRLMAHPGGAEMRTRSQAPLGKAPTRSSASPTRDDRGHRSRLAPRDVLPLAERADYSAVLAVGPEGGFTDEEVSRAVAAGWTLVALGPRTLRIETAAIALAAMIVGWETA
jgi:16S rRNA (uracil1498-N3)-methyltransferase